MTSADHRVERREVHRSVDEEPRRERAVALASVHVDDLCGLGHPPLEGRTHGREASSDQQWPQVGANDGGDQAGWRHGDKE